MARIIWREQGLRGFFRGLPASMVYIFPYVGINLAVTESLRPLLPRGGNGDSISPIWIVAGGAASSVLGQTIGMRIFMLLD